MDQARERTALARDVVGHQDSALIIACVTTPQNPTPTHRKPSCFPGRSSIISGRRFSAARTVARRSSSATFDQPFPNDPPGLRHHAAGAAGVPQAFERLVAPEQLGDRQ
jgi:hypothetical protein